MGLEIYAGPVGGPVGSYQHFHNFRKTVNELEGGAQQRGSRFPRLMLHSDHDGGYTPEEARELLQELQTVTAELHEIPYPTVNFLSSHGNLLWQSSIHGPRGELVLCAAAIKSHSRGESLNQGSVPQGRDEPKIRISIVGLDHRSLYIATEGNPFRCAVAHFLGEGAAADYRDHFEPVMRASLARIEEGVATEEEADFTLSIFQAIEVARGEWATLRRFKEFSRGSPEFELCGRYPPQGTHRMVHGLRPASEAFGHILEVFTKVAQQSIASGLPIRFC